MSKLRRQLDSVTHRNEDEQISPVADRFEWTPYPRHGPGAKALGHPFRALPLRPPEGKEAVYWPVKASR